jgi:hypothetical protein
MTATVAVLAVGDLSPKQILAGTLHDPDFAEIEAAVVITLLRDGTAHVSASTMRMNDLTYVERVFRGYVDAVFR